MRSFAGRPGFIRRRSRGPGWALVGDAGYWKDPVGAHGITSALRDSELLARALLSSEGADPTAATADYQATRDRISAGLFDVVDTLARQDWTDLEIPLLLRRLREAMNPEVELLGSFQTAAVR